MNVLSAQMAKFRQLTLRIRLKPFSGDSPETRAKERERRAALTTLAAMAAKAISITTMLVSVPLTIGYLGTERYGLWMTISSMVGILGFADLGLGNGLLNSISEAYGKDDPVLAREAVSSAFALLCGLGAIIAVLFGTTYRLLDWPRMFNVASPMAATEAGPGAAAFIVCFLINIPLGVVERVQLGYQQGFANSIWRSLGSVLGLVAVIIAIRARAGLFWLVVSMAGAPVIATLLNGSLLFAVHRPDLAPRLRHVDLHCAWALFRTGMLFFVLQITVAVAFSLDNIIISQILGAAAVAQYSVPARLFAVPSMLAQFITAPLWPAYGEAVVRGDAAWIRRTLARSIKSVAIVTAVPALFLIFLGGWLTRLWVGPEVTPSLSLLSGFAVWTVLMAAGNAIAMFLNGANVIGFQVICASVMSLGSIVLKIYLGKMFGIAGVVWALVLAFSLFTMLPILLAMPRILRKKLGRRASE